MSMTSSRQGRQSDKRGPVPLLGLLIVCSFVLFALVPDSVSGSGQFEVKLVRFTNPGGKGNNGHCCDGKGSFCFGSCDHYFKICADQPTGSHRDMTSCAVGQITTGTVNDQNTNHFGSSIGGTANPIVMRFTSWQRDVLLKIEAWDKDSNNDDFVDFLSISTSLSPAKSSQEARWVDLPISARTTLSMEIRAFCHDGYYGAACSEHCAPQDTNANGHYDCDQNDGRKICHPGWSGPTCSTNIDDCAAQPCLHGRCRDGVNGYTCTCQQGFSGVNCATDVDECSSSRLGSDVTCQNGGSCLNTVGGYECECSAWTTGPHCEVEIDGCESQPCGTHSVACRSDGRAMHHCQCAPGWSGVNCDVDACTSRPCLNGATCTLRVTNETRDSINYITSPSSSSSPTTPSSAVTTSSAASSSSPPTVQVLTSRDNFFECQCQAGYTGYLCDVSEEQEMDENKNVHRDRQPVAGHAQPFADFSTELQDGRKDSTWLIAVVVVVTTTALIIVIVIAIVVSRKRKAARMILVPANCNPVYHSPSDSSPYTSLTAPVSSHFSSVGGTFGREQQPSQHLSTPPSGLLDQGCCRGSQVSPHCSAKTPPTCMGNVVLGAPRVYVNNIYMGKGDDVPMTRLLDEEEERGEACGGNDIKSRYMTSSEKCQNVCDAVGEADVHDFSENIYAEVKFP